MIGSASTTPAFPVATSSSPAGNATPSPATPAPQKTTDDYCGPRRVFEGAAGAVGGFVGTAVNVIPSALGGGIQGVSRDNSDRDVANMQTGLVVGQGLVAGAVAGGLAFGPWGVLGGSMIGLVTGLAYGSMQSEGTGSDQIGSAIKEAVDLAVSDNEPSGSRAKDVSKDFSEGALVGGIAGGRASFGVGRQEAAGVAGGLIEGIRGSIGVIAGRYDPRPTSATPSESHGVLGTILRIPRVILRTAVGATCGLAGAVLNALDGTFEGLGQGTSHSYNSSIGLHRGLLRTEFLALGATAGTIAFGPVGGVAGGVGGLIVGGIVNHLARRSGSDRAHVEYVSHAIKSAAEENPKSDSEVYTAFRNGVQGAVVGTTASMKAGLLTGFEAGKGAVDGLMDAIKGVVDGILGTVRPGARPQPPAQQQPADPQP